MPLAGTTAAASLQAALEAPLERTGGARHAPAGGRRALYFLDDANAPSPDAYGTVAAGELLRQAVDGGGWWDAGKGVRKEVTGVQVAAALDPAAGTLALAPRLQRHFTVLTVEEPSKEALR